MEQAYDEVWSQGGSWDDKEFVQQIVAQAGELARTKFHSAREFVSIGKEQITVGIHADSITDKEVDRALELLSEVDTFEEGTYQVFGDMIQVYDT